MLFQSPSWDESKIKYNTPMRSILLSVLIFCTFSQMSFAQTSIKNYGSGQINPADAIGDFVNLINNLKKPALDPLDSSETGDEGLYMRSYPGIPEPKSPVTITIESGYINILDIDEIVWTVDGKRVAPKERINKIEVLSKEVGNPVIVRALIRDNEFGYITLEKVVLPMLVDILWEGIGIVPSWYKGKTLPTFQSPIKLTAIIDYKDLRGKIYTNKDFIFTWKRGYFNTDPPTLGANTAVLRGVDLRSNPTRIRLSVSPKDSNIELEKEVWVNSVRPTLLVYENDPIYGIIRERVVGKRSAINSADKTIISAIPYFFEGDSSEDIEFSWNIDGFPLDIKGNTVELTNPNSDLSSKQTALIDLKVINTNPIKFLQFDEYAISFNF